MLIREYHGFVVVSAQEEQPSQDGDGWDHIVVLEEGRVSPIIGTLAEAISLCKTLADESMEKPEAAEVETQEAPVVEVAEPADATEKSVEADEVPEVLPAE